MQAHVWQKIMFIYDVIAIFLTFTCFNQVVSIAYKNVNMMLSTKQVSDFLLLLRTELIRQKVIGIATKVKCILVYYVLFQFCTIHVFQKQRGYDITYVTKAYDICFLLVTPLYIISCW